MALSHELLGAIRRFAADLVESGNAGCHASGAEDQRIPQDIK